MFKGLMLLLLLLVLLGTIAHAGAWPLQQPAERDAQHVAGAGPGVQGPGADERRAGRTRPLAV